MFLPKLAFIKHALDETMRSDLTVLGDSASDMGLHRFNNAEHILTNLVAPLIADPLFASDRVAVLQLETILHNFKRYFGSPQFDLEPGDRQKLQDHIDAITQSLAQMITVNPVLLQQSLAKVKRPPVLRPRKGGLDYAFYRLLRASSQESRFEKSIKRYKTQRIISLNLTILGVALSTLLLLSPVSPILF